MQHLDILFTGKDEAARRFGPEKCVAAKPSALARQVYTLRFARSSSNSNRLTSARFPSTTLTDVHTYGLQPGLEVDWKLHFSANVLYMR